MWVCLWGFLYSHYFRFWLKWILRLLTGKCELQRILDGWKAGARRTLSIGNGRVPRRGLSAATGPRLQPPGRVGAPPFLRAVP